MKKSLIIIIVLLLCSGCYYTELNNLAVVDTLAVEKKDNKFALYLSVIDTATDKNNIRKRKIYVSYGDTFNKAYNNFYKKISKTIYLPSMNNLLIGFTLNNRDIKDIVNFFIKDKTSRNDFNIVYVKNSSILDILNSNININKLLLTNMGRFKNTSYISLDEFYNNSYSYIPTIYYKNGVYIGNYVLFKNYNYVAYLTKNESIIANIVNGKIKQVSLKINNNYIKVNNIKVKYNFSDNGKIVYSTINKNIKNDYQKFLKDNIKYSSKIVFKTTVKD